MFVSRGGSYGLQLNRPCETRKGRGVKLGEITASLPVVNAGVAPNVITVLSISYKVHIKFKCKLLRIRIVPGNAGLWDTLFQRWYFR